MAVGGGGSTRAASAWSYGECCSLQHRRSTFRRRGCPRACGSARTCKLIGRPRMKAGRQLHLTRLSNLLSCPDTVSITALQVGAMLRHAAILLPRGQTRWRWPDQMAHIIDTRRPGASGRGVFRDVSNRSPGRYTALSNMPSCRASRCPRVRASV